MRRVFLPVVLLALGCGVARAQDKAAPPKPAAPAAAGDLTDPTEILKKADEASKAVDSVKYTATFKGTGAEEARAPALEGTVYLYGFKNGIPEKYRYEMKARTGGSAEVKEVTIGGDGNEFFLIDPAKKIAYVDIDPAVIGSGRQLLRGLTMAEYTHEKPFSDEINAEKKEFKGTEKVGSEDTYHVWVSYGQQNQEADWYFSKKDFLPRRVDRKFPTQGGSEPRGSQLIVTSLTVDPKSDKDPFKFVLPDGYTKSEDFAP